MDTMRCIVLFGLLSLHVASGMIAAPVPVPKNDRPADMQEYRRLLDDFKLSPSSSKCSRFSYSSWKQFIAPLDCLEQKAANLSRPWGIGCGQTDPSKKDYMVREYC